jgi:hypothetical protein
MLPLKHYNTTPPHSTTLRAPAMSQTADTLIYSGYTAHVMPRTVRGFERPVFEVIIQDGGPVVDRFHVFKTTADAWSAWTGDTLSERTQQARTEYAATLPAFIPASGLSTHAVAGLLSLAAAA